jgi:hypothetical protein
MYSSFVPTSSESPRWLKAPGSLESRLGVGVVIHTVPATRHRLPIVVGYADNRCQWYQGGSRHVESPEADEALEVLEVEP